MANRNQIFTALIVGALFLALSGILFMDDADAKGGSFGGRSFSSGSSAKSSSFFGSSSSAKMSGSTSSKSSSFFGTGSSTKTSSSSNKFYGTTGTSKQTATAKFMGTAPGKSLGTVSNGKKTYTAGSVIGTSYTKGTNKITSTTPKTYISGSSYNKYGRSYDHVYYGSGFDLNTLLLMGFIMSHDDSGKVIYINNETKEMVSEEDFESAPESPGMESVFALLGLLGVTTMLRRKN